MVAQWWGAHLPIGPHAALEDAHAAEQLSHVPQLLPCALDPGTPTTQAKRTGACAPQQEELPQWEACAPQVERTHLCHN